MWPEKTSSVYVQRSSHPDRGDEGEIGDQTDPAVAVLGVAVPSPGLRAAAPWAPPLLPLLATRPPPQRVRLREQQQELAQRTVSSPARAATRACTTHCTGGIPSSCKRGAAAQGRTSGGAAEQSVKVRELRRLS
eukprot:6185490-Pleurochrysis_carterae.AAC.3